MKKIYLDDIRNPPNDTFVIVRSYNEAISYMIKHGCPEYISFDHDLGEDSLSGYDLVKWIINEDMKRDFLFIPKSFSYHVHSANPVGRENIDKLLRNYLRYKSEQR